MQLERRTIRVAGMEVPYVETNPSAGRTLLFLHGFGRHPRHYGSFLRRLAHEYDYRVVAPFLYANGDLPRPPESLRACIGLSRRFVTEMNRAGRLAAGYALVGHSTGGTVAQCMASDCPSPDAIVAVNPVFPVRHGPLGFVSRSARILLRQLTGQTGPASTAWKLQLRHGASHAWSLIAYPRAAWRLMRDLAGFQVHALRILYDKSGARGATRPQPASILYAPGDEFFELPPDLVPWMRLVFERFDLRLVREARGHEWLLMRPELAARRVAAQLEAGLNEAGLHEAGVEERVRALA